MKGLPDISKWLPEQKTSEYFKDIFYKRCLYVESLILNKVEYEKNHNIENFDSGPTIEDIIREEFSKILPERYFVTKGIVNDRNGFTAGDQDIIIFNNFWFPYLKAGATQESRRFFFPIEGVYAIGEIKQTLTLDTLDKAMEKLVKGKRLERPKTGRTRIVENRELNDSKPGHTNPLYSFILATSIDDNLKFDDIFERFFEINKQLKRGEIVNSLCVLKKATIVWCYFDENKKDLQPAKFINNDKSLYCPIIPVLREINQTRTSSFYDLIMHLMAHLYDMILGGEDLAVAYGNNYNDIKVPPREKFEINPK